MTWNKKALGIVFLAWPFFFPAVCFGLSVSYDGNVSHSWWTKTQLSASQKPCLMWTLMGKQCGNCLPQNITTCCCIFETSSKTLLPVDPPGTGSYSLSSCFMHCCGDCAIYTFSLWFSVFFSFCHVLIFCPALLNKYTGYSKFNSTVS